LNGLGAIGSISNGNATTTYGGYDAIGEVTGSSQAIGGISYPFLYSYNLAGSLISEKYPSGRVVNAVMDTSKRPVSLSGILNGASTTYVSAVSYSPQGAPKSLTKDGDE
jgi:hypothetical protein